MEKTSYKYEVIHDTLRDSPGVFSITILCELAGVSRSGYYAWIKAAPTREKREARDKADFELILAVYKKRGYAKGARSIYMGLLHRKPPVIMNIKKIRRLMKKFNLFCPIRKANPYRRMAKAIKTNNYADNLLHREFECYGPRYVLLTDITYIPYNGTFAYLSTILDAYTKQILSYVFTTFISIIEDADLRRSMSRRGNCWDNAPQESFFGHMKDHISGRVSACNEFREVKSIIDDFMDYYNNEDYVWELCMLSPNEYYEFITTGIYPLNIPNPPEVPKVMKQPAELGKKPAEETKKSTCQ